MVEDYAYDWVSYKWKRLSTIPLQFLVNVFTSYLSSGKLIQSALAKLLFPLFQLACKLARDSKSLRCFCTRICSINPL